MSSIALSKELINYSIDNDGFFRLFWRRKPDEEQGRLIALMDLLYREWSDRAPFWEGVHARSAKQEQIKGLSVQERPFLHSGVPRNWHLFVKDDVQKQLAFREAEEVIGVFVRRMNESGIDSRFYGGVKPLESIIEKYAALNGEDYKNVKQERAFDPAKVEDLWDVLRFRLVLPNTDETLTAGARLWQLAFDDIVRCRNYYFRPKGNDLSNTYRALHFEIRIPSGHLVEVQIVPAMGELIGYLDHSFRFKKRVPYRGEDHEAWLTGISVMSNLVDSGNREVLEVIGRQV